MEFNNEIILNNNGSNQFCKSLSYYLIQDREDSRTEKFQNFECIPSKLIINLDTFFFKFNLRGRK